MLGRNTIVFLVLGCLLAFYTASALAQSQTTGRIAGTVKDPAGAVVEGAEVTVLSDSTGAEVKVATDSSGNFAAPLLRPGTYRVNIMMRGFKPVSFVSVTAAITETTTVNADLELASAIEESVTVRDAPPLTQTDGPQLGRVVDSRAVSELPLATRNFTQILGLSPGTSVALSDNTALGRNSLNISVNGARVAHNGYEINGVDGTSIDFHSGQQLAVPAPESIQEFKVQTSLYDATFGRSGGGSIQVVTKSGGNHFHGSAYEYFRNEAFNANNPFLKASGVRRPVLKRNTFGGILGGPIQQDRAFFFASYQGTREVNAASVSSLSQNILIAPGLTDDRAEATLRSTFNVASVNPVSLTLLNTKFPSGQFVIPTPQANGRYSGSTPSIYREDQFNANVDYRITERNWLAAKFFFSHEPTIQALAFFSGNLPGFGQDRVVNNRVISVQNVYSFSSRVVNDARIGYNLYRFSQIPQRPLQDTDIGIRRANSRIAPGLSLIRTALDAGGASIGSSYLMDWIGGTGSITLADTLSITQGKHSIRAGAGVWSIHNNTMIDLNSGGVINFATFKSFLTGTTLNSIFGTGIGARNFHTTDYNFFVQDDWKLSPRLTLNLGLRYELDLPLYDALGRISTFDPSLYQPPLPLSGSQPSGPPIGGFVQAANVAPQYNLARLPKMDKRGVRSVDKLNFGPRIGFAYSPFTSGRTVIRGGYGIFYSPASTINLANSAQSPPNYVTGRRGPAPFENPFSPLPSLDKFPTFVQGVNLAQGVFDRDTHTPYFEQYNTSLQYSVTKDMLLEAAYVGARGLNLFRNVAINQARLASPQHPIVNQATGDVIITNTEGNARLRAPFQGAEIAGFYQIQSTAQSSYNSLQVSLTRRFSKGAQFLAAYTFAKSIDNASGQSASAGDVADFGPILGNQLDNRANRGPSDFDRTHRFVLSYLWDLSLPAFAKRSGPTRWILSGWQVAGIITAMSGLPIDITDSGAGTFYGLSGGPGLVRPNWAPGANRETAMSNIPAGYFFNPYAFARPFVQPGQPIPSSNGTAVADGFGADIGTVGRNVLRGPRQTNVDFSLIRRFRIKDMKNIEVKAEFFNLFNHVNFANPISNFGAIQASGGDFDAVTGLVTRAGDFGRITAASSNPRLIQFAIKINF